MRQKRREGAKSRISSCSYFSAILDVRECFPVYWQCMELKPTLLVVDDELGARQSLEVILEDDYRVLSAVNGREALEILQKEAIDLVLLDLNMPDMDGLEVLQKIKELDEEIDVVMVSALNLARKAADAIKSGAYDYITKPYEPEDILSTVNRVISKQRLHRELDLLRREVEETQGFDQIVSQDGMMLEDLPIDQEGGLYFNQCLDLRRERDRKRTDCPLDPSPGRPQEWPLRGDQLRCHPFGTDGKRDVRP